MHPKEHFSVGKFTSKFSFRGELLLRIDEDENISIVSDCGFVFILSERSETLLPLAVISVRPHKQKTFRVKIEGIDSEEKAQRIVGKEAFLSIEVLPKLKDDQFYYHELIGCDVLSEGLLIGKVQSIIDSVQPIMEVALIKGKNSLIPIVDDFIVHFEKNKRTIDMKLPPGLLEMNDDVPTF